MELLGSIFEFISFNRVDSWLEAGGFIVLFGLLFACGLGLPLPEDIPIMIAGALVARGEMHFATACIAAWCGIIGGDLMLYHFGKKFGLEITRVRFIGKHLTQARIEQIQQMFDQHGVYVVAIGRMFAGLRGAMVVAAGAMRFNFWKFLIADGLAAIVSGGLFFYIGHLAGENLTAETIHKFRGEFWHWVLLGLPIVLITLLIWMIWKRRRDAEAMEKVTAKVEKVAERVVQAAHLPRPPTKELPTEKESTARKE